MLEINLLPTGIGGDGEVNIDQIGKIAKIYPKYCYTCKANVRREQLDLHVNHVVRYE